MASNTGGNGPLPPPSNPNEKTLNVWSKPVDEAANPNRQPSVSEAVSMIKTDDFKNVANTPCARNGFLTGIASGFGVGGLRFILTGTVAPSNNRMFSVLPPRVPGIIGSIQLTGGPTTGRIAKSANWAAGFFVLGSMASFEYCQYLRRCEKRVMKRHIEVINEGRKEQARKLVDANKEQQQKSEAEGQIQGGKRWYKFW